MFFDTNNLSQESCLVYGKKVGQAITIFFHGLLWGFLMIFAIKVKGILINFYKNFLLHTYLNQGFFGKKVTCLLYSSMVFFVNEIAKLFMRKSTHELSTKGCDGQKCWAFSYSLKNLLSYICLTQLPNVQNRRGWRKFRSPKTPFMMRLSNSSATWLHSKHKENFETAYLFNRGPESKKCWLLFLNWGLFYYV